MRQTENSIERVKRDGQQQEQVVASLDRDIQLLNETERVYNGNIIYLIYGYLYTYFFFFGFFHVQNLSLFLL